jgi:hypothetical protein
MEHQHQFLLWLLDEVKGIRNEMEKGCSRETVRRARPGQSHPVDDGLYHVLSMFAGERKLPPLDDLSIRSQHMLKRSGIRFLSEMTRDRLKRIRGSGPAAVDEMIEWAESKK